jgi:thiamine-phosphate pyrophosphorylase
VWARLYQTVFIGQAKRDKIMLDISIINGVYAITPHQEDIVILIRQVEDCLKGGVSLVQYRSKLLSKKNQYKQAEKLKMLCDQYNKPLIINDDIELCQHLDAFGVHLGKDDDSLEKSRDLLGPNKIIGISCYNDWKRIEKAINGKADYVALGACFPSETKQGAPKVQLDMIAKAIKKYQTPIVAIGGINLRNVDLLIKEGVNCIALINGLFKEKNIETVERKFSQLI